jgi:hypothetical protein
VQAPNFRRDLSDALTAIQHIKFDSTLYSQLRASRTDDACAADE